MDAALLIAFGYLAGSIPFGVLVTRLTRGVDVRAQGSGNIGATNVARVAGKKVGVLVMLLDAGKGAVPVLVSQLILPTEGRVHAAVALAAFLGHVFPVWLRLRGGKGVATAFGVLLVLTPLAACVGFLTYALLFLAVRISSVGSLTAGVATVLTAFTTARRDEYAVVAGALFALMIFTHRANIRRLLRNKEQKL